MRWKDKSPKIGDVRVVTKFLLFPKCICGEWRWLEIASFQQLYRALWHESFWEDIKWMDKKS